MKEKIIEILTSYVDGGVTDLFPYIDADAMNLNKIAGNIFKLVKTNISERSVQTPVMPICPYCKQKMYLTTIEAGNGCGEYSQETIWECGCMSYELEKIHNKQSEFVTK